MLAHGTRIVCPFTTRSCGSPGCPAVKRRHASSRATCAERSAGTYQTGTPASFSNRESVRASSDLISKCFDELDEGQEKRTVEAVLVELARRHVRSCDHDHAEREQVLEQSTENHRIGNIGDVEFIEAKKPCLLRNG